MKTDNETKQQVLSFDEFMDVFRDKLLDAHEKQPVTFEIKEELIMKSSSELHGIIVRSSGKSVAPVFYYEDFYRSYINGVSIDSSVKQIFDYMLKNDLPGEDFGDKISRWKEAKDHLIIKLINAQRNRKLLKDVPHRRIGDMAAIVQIHIESEEIGAGTVIVDDMLLSIWDISTEKLFEQAFKNMNKFELDISDLRSFAPPNKELPVDGPNIYVLRYKAEIFGAPAILNTKKIMEFAEKKETDLFVMPVSIHEALLIEYRDDISREFLYGMLSSINSDHAVQDNVLSYDVFLLKRGNSELTYVSDGSVLSMCG